jgi:hypothetical protein
VALRFKFLQDHLFTPPLGALTPSEQGGKKDEDDSFVITIQEDEDKRSTKPREGVIQNAKGIIQYCPHIICVPYIPFL